MAIICECFEVEKLDESLRKQIREKAIPKYAESYLAIPFPRCKAYKMLGFTAKKGEILIGFALVTYVYSPCLGEIDQIHFEPGEEECLSPLIDLIEKTLADMGCIVTQYLYETVEGFPPPLEEDILIAKGWGLKTLHMRIYHFEIQAFHPQWMDKEYPLPPGFSFMMWKDVRPQELERIASLQSRFTFHYFISPLNESAMLQTVNSVALIFEEKVVGWMITHTFPQDPNSIRYTAFYVQPEYLSSGVAVPLLQHSIRLQQASPIEWAYFTIVAGFTENRWLRFVEKRIRQKSYRLIKIFRLSKSLL